MLDEGTLLDGKYRILRLIGEGGMGGVYEAEHAFLQRRVAIKVISPNYAQNPEAVKRFYREAQSAARIGHENICAVTDVGQSAGGVPYLVMELLHGQSLAHAIEESAPFPVGRTVDIATQVLEALSAAHAAGIVHRDMKPDNIFLTRVAGRQDFVKVLDFGISKVRRAGSTDRSTITEAGTVLGTPLYMSPEQAMGESDVDARTDVWAVGVIMYEMLSGRVPFEGENYNRILYNVISLKIPLLRTLRSSISPDVEMVVMRALQRELNDRFATAAEFREALLGAWMSAPEAGFDLSEEGATAVAVVPPEPEKEKKAKLPVHSSSDAALSATLAHESPGGSTTEGPTEVARMVPARARGNGDGIPRVGTVDATPGARLAPRSIVGSLTTSFRKPKMIIAAASGLAVLLIAVAILVVRGSEGGDTAGGPSTATAPAPVLPLPMTATPGEPRPEPRQVATQAAAPEPPPAASSPIAESLKLVPPPAPPLIASLSPAPVDAGSVAPAPGAEAGALADVIPVAPQPDGSTTGAGFLTVAAPTGIEVFLDGTHFARAPFQALPVAAGRHRLRLRNEAQGVDRQEWITVAAGGETLLRRTAQQLQATPRTADDASTGPSTAVVDGGTTGAGSRTPLFAGLPDDLPAAPSAPADAGARADAPRIRTRYGDGGRTP